MEQNHSIPRTDLKLPEHTRNLLKETLGEVVSGELPDKFLNNDCIITVGDVVTNILLKQRIEPDLALVDGKTRRGQYESREYPQEKTINIKNPAGMITREAWIAIKKGLDIKEPVLIYVDGEEDLLSLVSIALSSDGCLVIYGVPGEGMVINQVDTEIKNKTWEVINKMIKVTED